MEIELNPDAEEWLKAQVAQGRFGSIDEAVEILVRKDQVMQAELAGADLAWTKPYLAKGIADIEAGRTISAEQVHAELRSRFILSPKS
jgi:Arc/MetJ-type ribon-helix-helix transcriptional regulator